MTEHKFNDDAAIIAFVRRHTRLFADDAVLKVSEIGDGNINFVYRVAEPGGNSVIVKQALPYVRIIGEGWPLSLDRNRIEAEALVLEAEHAGDWVPQVYHYEQPLAAIIMQDLGDHQNLRHALIARRKLPKMAEHLGLFMARTLFHSSDMYLDAHQKKALVKRFINPDLCKITEDLFFLDPFCDHERNAINPPLQPAVEALWQDERLKVEVAELKYAFLNRAEALLHGDLHSGSVFVTETSTQVIDPEFAYFGPIGFDVGSLIGNLLLNWCGQHQLAGDAAEREAWRDWLLVQLEKFWYHFSREFSRLMQHKTTDLSLQNAHWQQRRLLQIWQDSLGFAGTELIRRTIGLAHVADLDMIDDAALRAQAEVMALHLGRELILERSEISSMEALVDLVCQLGD
ncbi:MAG: S-methyl-5-thioribose kinase [Marinobacterium sp.]